MAPPSLVQPKTVYRLPKVVPDVATGRLVPPTREMAQEFKGEKRQSPPHTKAGQRQ
jgi:hypothetical protein